MSVLQCDVESARETLEAAGVPIESGNTTHEQWRACIEGATAVAYDDKVVVQGPKPRLLESILRDENGRVHLYFDGASRGNPGQAAIGWVLISKDGIVAEDGLNIGRATNNRAEYEALVAGLEAARDFGFDEIEIRGDSELIVKQTRGEWDTNDPELRECRVSVRELLSTFDNWTIEHVPREINERADNLATKALDG